MVQLWINLPAKDKMSPPKYQALANKDIARYTLENGSGEIEMIAGAYKNVQGNASTFYTSESTQCTSHKRSKNGLQLSCALCNTALFIIEGSIAVNDGEIIYENHFVLLENSGEDFTIEAMDNARILIMSGEPIHEPIAAHGPFVMNTQAEIMQTFEDFQQGKFEYLQ
jgi:redox-sensitive bicupin YhaK (pirin superfamily)